MDDIVLKSENFELISELETIENTPFESKHTSSDSNSLIKDEIPAFLSPSSNEDNSSKCNMCGRTFGSR